MKATIPGIARMLGNGMPLSAVGSTMAKQAPEFDARVYGFAKLSGLIKAIQLFDVEQRTMAESSGKVVYVRSKKRT